MSEVESPQVEKRAKKPSLPQSDVPSYSLEDSLRVARAIARELGKQPSTPVQVAKAMGITPTTGPFRTITASSNAYGLTDGAAFAGKISLTPLGKRIVAPTRDDDEAVGKFEAVMKPRVTGGFLRHYNGSKWPRLEIGRNVLEEQFDIPVEQSERAFFLIQEDAQSIGVLVKINDGLFVSLDDGSQPRSVDDAPEVINHQSSVMDGLDEFNDPQDEIPPEPPSNNKPRSLVSNRRVFITHGKNTKIVGQIKKLLEFGDLVPVVTIEAHSTAKAVSDKVLDDMRSCSAAIVHVGVEKSAQDSDGNVVQIFNENVMIEIGAALALYGHRFILLVERGVDLPSNLQGLYKVYYDGNELDHDSTMNLLSAFADFKSDQ